MTSVGVVGLGNIGGAIAANLVADGHDVTVTDLDAARARAVHGAVAAHGPADVGARSELTFTSLPTPDAVAEVAGEWARTAAPGAVLVDLSTTLPAASQALAERLRGTGHHLVEAPLTGGAVGAAKRTLVFMVGGEPEPVARARPLLDALGRATLHLGPVGTGSTMKLVNSLLAFACTWASLEALTLAVAAGVDVPRAVEAVRTGGASNFFIDRAVEGIDRRGQPARFSLALAAKDAGLIEELAAGHGVPAPVAAAVAERLRAAVADGLGDHDWSDLVVAVERASGVPLRWAAAEAG